MFQIEDAHLTLLHRFQFSVDITYLFINFPLFSSSPGPFSLKGVYSQVPGQRDTWTDKQNPCCLQIALIPGIILDRL